MLLIDSYLYLSVFCELEHIKKYQALLTNTIFYKLLNKQ